MNEFLYAVDSAAIAGALLVSLALAIEAGYRIGGRSHRSVNEAFRSHVNTMAASLLGILALLLGFTLSLSLQRFDNRSEAVVNEANAIGTAYLRAELLPASHRDDMRRLLRDYTGLRVEEGGTAVIDAAARRALLAKTAAMHAALWSQGRQAALQDPNPVTTGLFIQALNEVIDQFGRRDAAINRHVPEPVLLLLYATFLMAGAIVGYAAGLAGHRASFVTYVMVALIAVLVFAILDLDRPRRGLVQVSQQSMTGLQAGMRADAAGKASP